MKTRHWIIEFAEKMYVTAGPDALGIAQRQAATATDAKAGRIWNSIVEYLEAALKR